jgi:hypothetical protein
MGWLKGFVLGFICVFRPDAITTGISVARGIVFIVKCVVAGLLFGAALLWITGCVSETDQRQHWQDCSGVYHEDCWDTEDSRWLSMDCEYEYYKECINGGQGGP